MADITTDPRNANRGTARGRALLESSLRAYGAGRSVLADKHGVLIAGNKTAEVALDLGLPTRVIETDGRELVVVRRTDLDLSSDPAAVELGLADNRVGEVSLEWDGEALAGLIADGADAARFWRPEELNALMIADRDIEIIGVGADEQAPRDNNNLRVLDDWGDRARRGVQLQWGDLMVVMDHALYDEVWAHINGPHYPDRRAGITALLAAGLAGMEESEC